MSREQVVVNGFRFLPPGLAAWINTFIPEEDFKGEIPFQPLVKPLADCTVAAVTSAGISLSSDPPFDMEREKREPTWGDPTYRKIPQNTAQDAIQVNHLHINTDYILEDINVMLPIAHLRDFAGEGIIGNSAPTAYSFYGFQWQRTGFLKEAIEPIAEQMHREGVDAAVMTPA
jgi:D-proline reductase (dithiol) PrdB